ncbi:hypothetical protein B0J13DRAFT_81994 [Dactylonectria estremocensis]|uniref:Mid2 domain-containing protein n=1 Tax=Dactylonectria estremocensis TaxID=1079267 RepID=A0A9P9IZQ8_9HYPO|nr:hypothetical protein B0J13DRAFT_81994 [Dactylonectria estremocensis]
MYHYAGLVGVLLGALVAGVRSDASFVLPPSGGPAYNYQDNPTYKVGKTISVEWTSDLSSMDIVIWQQYPAGIGSGFVRLVDHTTRLSIDWEVSLEGFNTTVDDGEQVILYMGMYETGDTNLAATSHYFNVTVPEDSTTTSATQSATSTGTGTGTSTSAASATTTGAETTSASAEPTSDDSGLSTGAIAGIGVGSAVVGIAALAGLGFFFWKRRQRAGTGGQYQQSHQSPPPDEIKTHELASAGWNHAPPQRPHTGPTGLYEAP